MKRSLRSAPALTLITSLVVTALAPAVLAQESAGSSSGVTNTEFTNKIGTMEEQVNAEKERVFRSKATLLLLKEIVLQGSDSAARSEVVHVNHLGGSYRVESVSYYLDNQSIFTRFDPSGALDEAEEIAVWDGAIPPGQHQLTVSMVLRGNGFRIFDYVQGYSFKVQSSYNFSTAEAQSTVLRVVVDEKKGFGIPYTERPTVEFQVSTQALAGGS